MLPTCFARPGAFTSAFVCISVSDRFDVTQARPTLIICLTRLLGLSLDFVAPTPHLLSVGNLKTGGGPCDWLRSRAGSHIAQAEERTIATMNP